MKIFKILAPLITLLLFQCSVFAHGPTGGPIGGTGTGTGTSFTDSAGFFASINDEVGTGYAIGNTNPRFVGDFGIGSAILLEADIEILDDAAVEGLTHTELMYLKDFTGVSGSGNLSGTTSPIFTTPSLGAATATSITLDASATPAWVFRDSGNPGTDKEIAKIYSNFLSGADGAEDGSVFLQVMVAGTEANVIQADADTAIVEVGGTGLHTKLYVSTVTDADGFTMTAPQGFGYVIYATGAGTIVMPPVTQGMQFTVETHAAAAVVLNPDASGTEDTIRLDGVALSIGDSITNLSTAGDIAVCTYYAADTWSCTTNGWTDTN